MANAQLDLSSGNWRKSSFSNGDGGHCVEVRDDVPGIVPVRDSKTPAGPALMFPASAWAPFVGALKGVDVPMS